ncbi:MAG: L-aspartate oxidase [Ardenticatenia bacterium]|nr:L-aspartate oxidase [Ardenticatenia bacterium]
MCTDVVVIGCGIAGSVAALRLADLGFQVAVLTRADDPHESNTYYAQGGIVYRGYGDTPDLLAKDIVRAGDGLNDPRAVALLAELGPKLVKSMLVERAGIAFDRDNGALAFAREGGHTVARILHVGDATGQAIQRALITQLRAHPNIALYPGWTALELIVKEERKHPRCLGAVALNRDGGEVRAFWAGRTVLATGGFAAIFARTTNPAGARGDGLAMAARAGAQVAHLEYVQFHPTAFALPGAPSFLISEAVRGAGARLVHADGSPFMRRYAPEWGDLAPRDVVARAIFHEMRQHQLPHVYLDVCSAMPAEAIKARFPNLYATCLRHGVDMTCDLVPVAPAAHYTCGGVLCDEWGRTTVRGLYAVGEVACTGLHGANRLASTSLLEGVVWGTRVADHISRTWTGAIPSDEALMPPVPTGTQPPPEGFVDLHTALIRRTMWAQVGLVRSRAGLEEALAIFHQLRPDVEAAYRHGVPDDGLVGLRNMLQVAILVTQAALENPNSRGCHFRAEPVATSG